MSAASASGFAINTVLPLASFDEKEQAFEFNPATASKYVTALDEMISYMQAHDVNPNPKALDAVRGLISEIVVSPS